MTISQSHIFPLATGCVIGLDTCAKTSARKGKLIKTDDIKFVSDKEIKKDETTTSHFNS